jgi:hypothetical protein
MDHLGPPLLSRHTEWTSMRLRDYDFVTRHMSLETPTRFGPYETGAFLGAGGPASVRAQETTRELWRGLAEAQWFTHDR